MLIVSKIDLESDRSGTSTGTRRRSVQFPVAKEFKCTWNGNSCQTDFSNMMTIQAGCIIRNWTDKCPLHKT